MARQRDITFYLIKEDIVDFDDVLPDSTDTSRIDLGTPAGLPFEGRLLIKIPEPVSPGGYPGYEIESTTFLTSITRRLQPP